MLFSVAVVPIYIPTNSIREFSFPHTLSSICYLYRLFDDGHSDQSEVIPHCSFDLHFSNDQQCCTSFDVSHLYVFSHFLIGLFVFFVIELSELFIQHILLSSCLYLLFSIATSTTLVQPPALSLQFSSGAQSRPTLCEPMELSLLHSCYSPNSFPHFQSYLL